jgi:sugar diacid utilization regulator
VTTVIHEPSGADVGPTPAARAALRDALQLRLGELAEDATRMIIDTVPAYRDADPKLRDDVKVHVLSHLTANLRSFDEGHPVTAEDMLFVRAHAARRVRQVRIADFVHAFYVGEQVLWQAALALATDDPSRRAALALATHLTRYFEVATTHAAEVYLEVQEQLAETGERIRRDLLEDLLAGRPIQGGPRLEAARAAGLQPDSRCLVISAIPTSTVEDEQLLRVAASSIARATRSRLQPLTVVRHCEIVVVPAVRQGTTAELEQRLTQAQRRLADTGLSLAVGVSTVVEGVEEVPQAYREAESARAALRSAPGVIALAEMSAFEYLTLREDAAASRLVSSAIRQFVSQDLEDGGALIDTLRVYVDADLNSRRTAQRMHVHVNTVHYRLGKIAERTGLDLRNVTHLIELLIAARLATIAKPAGS